MAKDRERCVVRAPCVRVWTHRAELDSEEAKETERTELASRGQRCDVSSRAWSWGHRFEGLGCAPALQGGCMGSRAANARMSGELTEPL